MNKRAFFSTLCGEFDGREIIKKNLRFSVLKGVKLPRYCMVSYAAMFFVA